jgi:hypothetical protein
LSRVQQRVPHSYELNGTAGPALVHDR